MAKNIKVDEVIKLYLIPKNIHVKKVILYGFSLKEIVIIAVAFVIGFFVQSLTDYFKLKVFLFVIFPMITIILLFPLPNNSNIFEILKKFVIFQHRQKNYKLK